VTIRVLIADDQPLIRSGLRSLLTSQDDLAVVGEAADGVEAVAAVASTHPHVVLMDVRMPGLDGIAATARITAASDPPKIVILTTYDLDEYVYDALTAGASGFLLKDVRPEDLVHGVRVAAAGNALLAPAATRRLLAHFTRDRSPDRSTEHPGLSSLTPRERDVLTLVARGLTNPEIAAALHLSDSTVKTHIGHVFGKLAVRDRVQAVIVAYRTGLVS
jgi:DNA-binding NarL/FixJ family response regulator